MSRLATVLLLFAPAASTCLCAQATREIILATNRTTLVELIDPATLDTIARLRLPVRVERVQPSHDGRAILIDALDPGCCKQYFLDLSRLQFTENTSRRDTADTQRSPDGHWRFEPKSFRGPRLAIVNLETNQTSELIPPDLPPENSEGNWAATGAWSQDRFYLYIVRPNHPGFLWTVHPGDRQLESGLAVDPFAEAPDCRSRLPVAKTLLAAGSNLFLYEPFGATSDRTGVCQTPLPGGAWKLDPATGRLTGYIAPQFHFFSVVANYSGSVLYGVDPGSANWSGQVSLWSA